MMPSHWKRYNEEIGTNPVIEYEWGFADYSLGPDTLVINNVYIVPEERGKKRTDELEAALIEVAKENGKDFLIGKIQMFVKKEVKINSLQMQLARGYEPYRAEGDVLYLRKEIK